VIGPRIGRRGGKLGRRGDLKEGEANVMSHLLLKMYFPLVADLQESGDGGLY
jgi:hypothetical protein